MICRNHEIDSDQDIYLAGYWWTWATNTCVKCKIKTYAGNTEKNELEHWAFPVKTRDWYSKDSAEQILEE